MKNEFGKKNLLINIVNRYWMLREKNKRQIRLKRQLLRALLFFPTSGCGWNKKCSCLEWPIRRRTGQNMRFRVYITRILKHCLARWLQLVNQNWNFPVPFFFQKKQRKNRHGAFFRTKISNQYKHGKYQNNKINRIKQKIQYKRDNLRQQKQT